MKKNILVFILIIMILTNCSPDDGGGGIVTVEVRDRAEQQVTDLALLQEYFDSHYYNSGAIESIENLVIDDIVITELAEGESVPDGHTLLSQSSLLLERTTNFEDVSYTYYVLKLNEGGGEKQPNFSDRVRVTYEGALMEDSSVFDSAVTPTDFYLVGIPGTTINGSVVGWQRVLPEFKETADFTLGEEVQYDNYGVGVMFLPSGLGYFSRTLVGIPAYSNIMFKFTLLQVEETDFDNDNVPSYLEDLNGNLDVFDDDTDEDGIANYNDPDDDNDGVPTIFELLPQVYEVDTNNGEQEPILAENEFEIDRNEVGGVITISTVTIVDANDNGIPDYLEAEVTTNYNEN